MSALPEEGSTRSAMIVLNCRGRQYRVVAQSNETVLSAARRIGAPIGSNCERGDCGACMVELTAGEVRMEKNAVLSDDEVASGIVLACQSVPVSEEIRIDLF